MLIYWKTFKKNGVKRLKCGSVPAKADVEAQEVFFHTTLYPLMEKARNGEATLLFMDASHFVMGCDFLGHIYGKTRRFIKTFSGRKRYNVLGTLDYISKKVLTVANDSYITAAEVCKMLWKVSAEYTGKAVYVILDNARYQKCEIVQSLAKQLDIQLVYIPPYSPNLNLIERLWKFVKGELRAKYYDDFSMFRHRIDAIIASTGKDNKYKIDKLLGRGIQLFHCLVPLDENAFKSKAPIDI